MIQGVLFDMDGVLLDSEAFITEAGIQLFREKGFSVTAADFKPFTGMGEDRFLGGVAEKYSVPFDAEKDKARAYAIYEHLVAGKLTLLNGARGFIEKCKKKNLKLAVATSADEIKMRINLHETGLTESLFDSLVTGNDVRNKKPHPEIYLLAARRLSLEPVHCLVVEDAISGVDSAIAAGCKCLALTTSFTADQLSKADWIASDLGSAPDKCLTW